MSDNNIKDGDFLARWSRRKQQARAGETAQVPEQPDEAPVVASDAAEPGSVESGPDLSNLPPIESIDAATDITAFLRKGIPQELSRAALRRAWSADPAIRDFIGLAESAWDFNDPNAMPGFGPLDWPAEQVEALVRRVVGDVTQAVEHLPSSIAEAAEGENIGRSAPIERDLAQSPKPVEEISPVRRPDVVALGPKSDSAAPQRVVSAEVESAPGSARRHKHGGALPE
jgi:hypothetical protein